MQKKRVQRGHFSSNAVFKRGQNRASKIKYEYINIPQRTHYCDNFGSIFHLERSSDPWRSLQIGCTDMSGSSHACPQGHACPGGCSNHGR